MGWLRMDEIGDLFGTLKFSQLVVLGVVPSILLVMALLLTWRPLVRIRAYFSLQKLIRGLGADRVRDIYLPGGLDGHIYVEYLVLTPHGLLLLHVKPYYGMIFAAEHIEQWTQVIGHHSYKFSNPLYQLQTTLGELRSVFPKITIEGGVLFTSGSQFPKGKPERVYLLEEIRELGKQNRGKMIPDTLQAIWGEVQASNQRAGQIRLNVYLRRGDKRRLVYGAGLLIAALVWLASQFLWV
jgi:hypothetical protein